MTTTDRKAYAVKAETLEQVLDILTDMDKDMEALKASVGILTKGVEDARRIAIVAILTATGAVVFSAFSLWLH